MAALEDPTVPIDLLEGLNAAQAAAVQALLGPLLVVAGPGSGKTRVLTHRAAALVRTRLAHPSQVLAVTFTNKAAGEMRERLVTLLGEDDVSRMWVTTFHSMCARMLRLEHDAARLPRAFTILDSGDVRTVLKQVVESLGWECDASEIRGFASEISRFKNGGRVKEDRRLPAVMAGYATALERLASLDFDDLLLRTAELLEGNPDVLERFRARFRFVLVDEYQDTNPVQYRLIALLSTGHRNLCVVGDADQSIYGFRSATPEALNVFARDWPESRTVILEQNYRSSASIVEACRTLIDMSESVFRPKLFTENAAGEQVRVVVCADDRDEGAFVASELASRPVDASSAVLVRTNSQSRQFEEALLFARIPYTVVGALRFYERAEVKDAVAYLRLVANPQDGIALSRIVAAPRRGLGPKAVAGVTAAGAGGSLIAAIDAAGSGSSKAAVAWRDLSGLLARADAAARASGPADALRVVLDGGLREFVARSGEKAEERVGNLEELVSAARLFAASGEPAGPDGEPTTGMSGWEQTEAFLGNIALVSAVDTDAFEAARGLPVQLMTAHASKGKEFDLVYVCGVEEGLFPHSRGSSDDTSDEEERRLLFVACSRARRRLTLTRAVRRMTFGKHAENSPSRFIADLPDTVRTVVRSGTPTRQGWAWSDRSGTGQGSRRPPADRSRSASGRGVQGPSGSVSTGPAGPAGRPARVASGPRLDASDAVCGTLVAHAAFGPGEIIEVTGLPGDLTVTVRFADGPRMLKVALAPLALT